MTTVYDDNVCSSSDGVIRWPTSTDVISTTENRGYIVVKIEGTMNAMSLAAES